MNHRGTTARRRAGVAACYDFNVHVWDALTMERVRVLRRHAAEVHHVTFSQGGRILASAGWDNRTYLWDAASGAALVSASGVCTGFDSSDGRLGFKIGSYRRGSWRLAGGREYRVLAVPAVSPREKHPQEVRISPDGRWLAAPCGSYGARL